MQNIDCYYSVFDDNKESKVLTKLVLFPKYFHDLDIAAIEGHCIGTREWPEAEYTGLLDLLSIIEKTEDKYKIFEKKGPGITLTIASEKSIDPVVMDDTDVWNINNTCTSTSTYKFSELKNQIESKKKYLEAIGYKFIYKTVSEEENLSRFIIL